MGIEVNDKDCVELLKLLPVDGELYVTVNSRQFSFMVLLLKCICESNACSYVSCTHPPAVSI